MQVRLRRAAQADADADENAMKRCPPQKNSSLSYTLTCAGPDAHRNECNARHRTCHAAKHQQESHRIVDGF